ncbi:hypothetical protein FF38_01623 [Lucilia cuprina]|uniref:Uncharacterized protein n=1 Tax=Lucilia cuprina TaxID=7375 RepID=A0A0L0CF18_LUCCU|nr:hypothetical protein FF38_01623 [Lucilia cuprina]
MNLIKIRLNYNNHEQYTAMTTSDVSIKMMIDILVNKVIATYMITDFFCIQLSMGGDLKALMNIKQSLLAEEIDDDDDLRIIMIALNDLWTSVVSITILIIDDNNDDDHGDVEYYYYFNLVGRSLDSVLTYGGTWFNLFGFWLKSFSPFVFIMILKRRQQQPPQLRQQ